jgi:hypothetical protein
MTLARVLLAVAIILAALVARERHRHRPIAVALLLVLGASLARSALPEGGAVAPRASLALLLVPPVAGAWAAAVALRACPWPGTAALCAWAGLAAVVGLSASPGAWWASPLPAVHLLGVAAQAAALARWLVGRGRAVTVTERTLLALLAGDVAGAVAPIVGGGPWELARVVAGAAMVAACVVQAAELRVRGKDGP